MCLPATLTRFRSFHASPEIAGGMGMSSSAATSRVPARRRARPPRVSRVVDLTHALAPHFPSWPGYPSLEVRNTHHYTRDGFFANAWHVHEHSGTHVDAPLHFSARGLSAADIPARSLVVPVVVVDIRKRAHRDPDAEVRVEDIRAWEKRHGRVPRGAAVLMWSGWETRAGDESAYRNMDAKGVMHFPGFSPEAAQFLVQDRAISGIGVDTLSLDNGPSTDFGAHVAILPADRWGIENLANLGKVPSKGATIVLGLPRVQGASGGPARIIALW
jgi:kynurenine formamidase